MSGPNFKALPKMKGLVSSLNFVGKREHTLILFINNRLVEHNGIKKAIREAYSPLLGKGQFSWCYLSMTIAAESIDVNVHPTKKEVHFASGGP